MTRTATKSSHTWAARILIVDDHPIVRDGLIAALSRHPDLQVCGEAATVADAIKLIDSMQPDLAIIDLSLPDGSGLDLIKRIKARNASIKMLVLSMSDESLYAERALRAGAMGFLHKQEAREKLLDAIHQIPRRKGVRQPSHQRTPAPTGDGRQTAVATFPDHRTLRPRVRNL